MGSFFDNNPFSSNTLTKKWTQFVTREREIYHERRYHKWSRMSHVTIIADLQFPIDNHSIRGIISESECRHLVFDGAPIYPYSIIRQLNDGVLRKLHTLALRNMDGPTLGYSLTSLLKGNSALQCLEFSDERDTVMQGDLERIFNLVIPSEQVCIRRYYHTDQT